MFIRTRLTRVFLFLVIISVSCSKDSYIQIKNELEKQGWELTFNDEFNDTELDKTKWRNSYRWGRGGEGGACYLDSNYSISNGRLSLIGKKENCPCYTYTNTGHNYFNTEFSSGMLCSSETFEQTYGFFEIKCKVPKGKGVWPAFWLESNYSWPPEIDIFEFQGNHPEIIHMASYYKDPKDRNAAQIKVVDCSVDFHVYSLEWNKDFISWYFDNQKIRTIRKKIPSKPMHIVANLQLNGGGFAGHVDSTTVFPSVFEIEYIRVYKKTDK